MAVENLMRDVRENSFLRAKALEILLAKWQSDGTYLKYTHDLLANYDALSLAHFQPGSVFKVIDEETAPHERKILIKSCLKRMLVSHWWPAITDCQRSLTSVFQALSWEEVKIRLNEFYRKSAPLGECFYACALVVFAEKFLTRCNQDFLDLRMRTSEANDDRDSAQLRGIRKSYMDILNDFSDTVSDNDLDPIFYRYALQLSKWHEDCQARELQQRSEKLEKSLIVFNLLQGKYRELKSGKYNVIVIDLDF